MAVFTKEEAVTFVKVTLSIEDAENQLGEPVGPARRELLDRMVAAFQDKVPFHTLTLISQAPEKRHRPNVSEVKSDILSCLGGLCYTLNTGFFHLISALGYDAEVALSHVTSGAVYSENHVVCLVRNVEKPGDLFLTDVGVATPTLRAIDLSFDTESPEFIDSFIEYKYIKHEGKILRMQRRGCALRAMGPLGAADFYIGEWRRLYFVYPEGTKNINAFDECFDSLFTNNPPEYKSSFHQGRFTLFRMIDGRAVFISKDTLLLENDKGEMEKSQIEGGPEGVIATVRKYFPTIPEKVCRDALVYSSFEKAEGTAPY